jgi:hypothetical protein
MRLVKGLGSQGFKSQPSPLEIAPPYCFPGMGTAPDTPGFKEARVRTFKQGVLLQLHFMERRMGNGIQDVPGLLYRRANKGTDTGKCLRPLHRSKAARYFLLHLHHPKVLFRLVVRKGNVLFAHEPQGIRIALK